MIIECLFYVTIGIFFGFVCWLIADIKEAVELKLKKTSTTNTTTNTTITTNNREYYVHGGIVYDPNGNPI